ncbi:hypothetical protein GCM10010987_65290 [Bradyrhizobium guangdongense]|uniref:Uncharacterized protein n=1 Tax=Bradyrhizobium guangdongense TaxID=1325090 RepID=A0AA87W9N1_9BRAD|nr:hypothetical protein GCM10010987_65290 [Bradyrhizobium guangdongense]
MRSTVIAAITSAATTSGRREASWGFTEMSGAIVTAALFPDLGGGVNVATVMPGKRSAARDDSGGVEAKRWARR